MNHANPHPSPLTPHQPSLVVPALSQADEPSLDSSELTVDELQAVAGGPLIVNGSE